MNFICTTDFTPEEIAAEHRHWGTQLCASVKMRFHHSVHNEPDKRLRLGYLSGDFYCHPVAFFIEPLLSMHDQEQFEIFVYSNVEQEDYVTEQIRQRQCVWRSISGISDDDASSIIHEDKIDILIDLAGLTRHNRLPVFARKPAPLQVTWLGYAHSTGLPDMDYRFTDAIADPPGMTEHLHTETLYRLPDCFLAYHPPINPPPVSALPSVDNGYITFVAFNNLAKTNDQLLRWWAELLKKVPGSRLCIKNNLFPKDYRLREEWLDRFALLGITADRVVLKGHAPDVHQHLEMIGQGDIALDSYPYNGTTTTCETLWMGVPVVTLAGPSHVSRVSASLLSCIGAAELIANNPDEYIDIAVKLATDQERLQFYRVHLRGMVQASSLMNHVGFARKIEAAYRDIWHRWCATQELRYDLVKGVSVE